MSNSVQIIHILFMWSWVQMSAPSSNATRTNIEHGKFVFTNSCKCHKNVQRTMITFTGKLTKQWPIPIQLWTANRFLMWIKRQKSLAQEVRQKSDISEHRTKGWREICLLQSLLCSQYGRWVTMPPVWDHVTRKINNVFYHKLDGEYLFFNLKFSCL